MRHSMPFALKLIVSAAAICVLAAPAALAEPASTRLDCKLGYDALLTELKTRQDMKLDDYPFGVEFHKSGAEGVAYYFTKTPHAAHPAIFWYGKGGSCQSVKASGCGFGKGDAFNHALGKFQAHGSNGC